MQSSNGASLTARGAIGHHRGRRRHGADVMGPTSWGRRHGVDVVGEESHGFLPNAIWQFMVTCLSAEGRALTKLAAIVSRRGMGCRGHLAAPLAAKLTVRSARRPCPAPGVTLATARWRPLIVIAGPSSGTTHCCPTGKQGKRLDSTTCVLRCV